MPGKPLDSEECERILRDIDTGAALEPESDDEERSSSSSSSSSPSSSSSSSGAVYSQVAMIEFRWLLRLKKFIFEHGASEPGPITNDSLLGEDGMPPQCIRERFEFMLMDMKDFDTLQERFGGGPKISLDTYKLFGSLTAETAPLVIEFHYEEKSVKARFYRRTKISQVKEKAKELLLLPNSKPIGLRGNNRGKRLPMSEDNMSLIDYLKSYSLMNEVDFFVEYPNEKGEFLPSEEQIPDFSETVDDSEEESSSSSSDEDSFGVVGSPMHTRFVDTRDDFDDDDDDDDLPIAKAASDNETKTDGDLIVTGKSIATKEEKKPSGPIIDSESEDEGDELLVKKMDVEIPSLPDTGAKEYEIIENLMDAEPMASSKKRALIPASWWEKWARYTGHTQNSYYTKDEVTREELGEIKTTKLCSDGTADLSPSLSYSQYSDLPLSAYQVLKSWYGVSGPDLIVDVVKSYNQYSIELNPLKLKIKASSKLDAENIVIRVSKSYTVAQVKRVARKALGIQRKTKNLRLWDYFGSRYYKKLDDDTAKIGELQILDNQEMVLEERDADGTFTVKDSSAGGSSYSGSNSYYSTGYGYSGYSGYGYGGYDSYYSRPPEAPGLVGLQNLGNTCFMNSGLQCLSNTRELRQFFLSQKWKDDLNADNPLSRNGEFATEFSEFIKKMWKGNQGVVSPSSLKATIGKYAPQFAGFSQQDSHELIINLLDGLHEDLNRVKHKPYVEIPEYDGKVPEAQYAEECWQKFLLRNQSHIVDIFFGQSKTTIVCPVCKKVVIKFEAFSSLGCPIPQNKKIGIKVKVLFKDRTKKPTTYKFILPEDAPVSDLKAAIVAKIGSTGEVFIAEAYRNTISKFHGNDVFVSELDSSYSKILAFEADKYDEKKHKIAIVTITRKSQSMYSTYDEEVGDQALLVLPKDITGKEFAQRVRESVCSQIDLDKIKKLEDDSEMESETIREPEHMKMLMVTGEYYYKKKDIIEENDQPALEDIKKGEDAKVEVKLSSMGESAFKEEVPNDDESLTQSVPTSAGVSLGDCLDIFSHEAILEEENKWYCPQCKEHRQASVKTEIWKAPKVCIIHLKRFQYRGNFRSKIETEVNFPDELDLSSYILDPANKVDAKYELYAISNHYGSLGGGHYTAFAMNKGKWYSYNDSTVSAVGGYTGGGESYLLFYRRKSDNEEDDDVDATVEEGSPASQSQSQSQSQTTITNANASSSSSSTTTTTSGNNNYNNNHNNNNRAVGISEEELNNYNNSLNNMDTDNSSEF
eukprot:TRINITY_DN265_c0_g2_i3.p1 TRINITY_DN265_c0_g2~~TRINITY_DN265_c0_g2_i3.p1  ORF type:complete len:1276 (+),score=402.87 TRINITY_DN265_c0_g2_i3:39-3830(+)